MMRRPWNKVDRQSTAVFDSRRFGMMLLSVVVLRAHCTVVPRRGASEGTSP